MSKFARHKNRLFYITVILLLFILVSILAPAIFRNMFPTPHALLVERYAEEHQLQTALVYAVIRTESGFREKVVSPKGAVGLMQITENTGIWIASMLEVQDFSPEDLKVPETNIRFGCWYLSYLMKRFKGNTELALAAYNAGEGTVSGWIDSGAIVWEDLKIKNVPYKETEQYLMRVNRLYFVYKTLYPDMDS
ncbi:MAG: lytic transglycosylase domain-containing protein [Clostridiaceae bacterium]|jgi:soluble lytic murein transglycosylase|nr:lytic transglycosylase domain-containing protein [Clostridiaceae bacterium]